MVHDLGGLPILLFSSSRALPVEGEEYQRAEEEVTRWVEVVHSNLGVEGVLRHLVEGGWYRSVSIAETHSCKR